MAIPITKAFFGPEELRAVQIPLETGWVVQGPFVKQFEEKFSAFTGASHSIAASSCTTALHIAAAALKLKPGDEVIVPAFTWISTPNAVRYMGATPIFCDIELGSFNIDAAQIEGLITERTVGIIPVHLFGLCADMSAIELIARRHKLWIIEDAACAFGSKFKGADAGTMGDLGCFSFHPRKSITTGEGGMITTAKPELDATCRSLRDHGASRSDLSRHQGKAGFLLSEYNHLGYNFRMTDIQGALGCAQMDRARDLLDRRAAVARRYDQMLPNLEWLAPPAVPDSCVHSYQSYVCLYRPESPTLANVHRLGQQRNELMQRLEAQGIATRQGTHAPALVGYYADLYNLRPEQFPNATIAEALSLALPLYPQMTEQEQDTVVAALSE